ncbi:non-homologous end-joining DNA ligase [Rickettsiella grylli]|uniref:non-homologous end-joining DNA ligase n=1 Tax=Rickettsiella grylli TaxID=59196 RepID=UPI0002E82368|nr:non-homologous end-joining DNA ligase [Rickettsiella grylli]
MTINSKKMRDQANRQVNANVHLSHPDKILYPDANITKLDLAHYYQKIEKWILPFIINRPLTLLRCPQGQMKKCFYQRHVTTKTKHVYAIHLTDKTSQSEPYLYIKNKWGLIELIQLDVLEIHPWSSRIDSIERPDFITFDLDPGMNLEWKKVIEAAFLVKEHLKKIHLHSFVKTTGSKGLHVVVPIKRLYRWDKVKVFTQTFVNYLAMQNPSLFVAHMNKAKRTGKIFIDYLRNQRGASSIAPYSTRMRRNASIATPLSWDELNVRIKSDTFTLKNLPKRFASLKRDPWENFYLLKQKLSLPVL